jgi:hypothetical protein
MEKKFGPPSRGVIPAESMPFRNLKILSRKYGLAKTKF